MQGNKQYGMCKWKDFVQKTWVATNEEKKKAKLSSFKNVRGKSPNSMGRLVADVRW